jgi:hypothetical protein
MNISRFASNNKNLTTERFTGHMLDWPLQYHMSPNVTFEMLEVVVLAGHPEQVVVMVYSPPAACGCSMAFQLLAVTGSCVPVVGSTYPYGWWVAPFPTFATTS